MKRVYTIILILCIFTVYAYAKISGTTSEDVIDTEAFWDTNLTKQQRQALVGSWYRKQPTTKGGFSEELAKLNADGSYIFKFRVTQSNKNKNTHIESGLWGIADGYHFTILVAKGSSKEKMRRVDPENHTNYWVYKVLDLKNGKFRYQSLATGNVFELYRVAENFELP
jgi:hypothetical protein